MSSLQEVALVVIGILVIFAIGWLIARDARRRAPVADPDHPGGPEHHRRSGRRRSRDRARSRAARHARRSNRS